MKAITVKAPIAWGIFNADYRSLYRYEFINCPTQLAIHVSKSCSSADIKKFSQATQIFSPDCGRLLLGQVVGVVEVKECVERYSDFLWKISNPMPIKQFDYKGQLGIYEIPDSRIDYDFSKNPIIEECGYKFKGNPRGQWRVAVWPHPATANHYSYSVAILNGVMGGGIPGHDLLHGCFADPEEALTAGIKELYDV
ncbi:hypothetical protein [Nostoc sp.]